ncbi:MAG: DNA repair protein RecO [Bacteroidota bacterium]
MIEKTLGIVLSQIKFGETSLIVHLYTRRWGRMGILVPGARTSSKNRKTHLFQPLTILELEVYYKSSRDLQKIKEARNHSPFVHMTGDPVKSSVALFLSEVLNKTLREETPNEDLFDFLSYHIQYLDVADHSVANFHIYFLIRLARYFGFNPGLPDGDRRWLELLSGVFLPDKPQQGQALPPDMTSQLVAFMQIPVSEIASINLNRHQRQELLDGILRFYMHHLEGIGEIRSHLILQALFD